MWVRGEYHLAHMELVFLSFVYNFMLCVCVCVCVCWGGGGGGGNSTSSSEWDSAAPSFTDRSVKGAD